LTTVRRSCGHQLPVGEGEAGTLTYVVAEPCVDVKDRAGLNECPVDRVYEGERTLYINLWFPF